jgi:hypothetical protein
MRRRGIQTARLARGNEMAGRIIMAESFQKNTFREKSRDMTKGGKNNEQETIKPDNRFSFSR